MKDKTKLLLIAFSLSIIILSSLSIAFEEVSPIIGLATRCFPDYECASWGVCVDGLQSRTCEDNKCGRRDIVERRFCDKPGCRAKIECLEWSECIYTEKINDFINGRIGFGGYHTRLCRDASGCVDSFSEERACEEFYSLKLEKIEECNEEFLVAIDPASERPVAKISLDSWRSNKLDIFITQGDKRYCPACYNGVLDTNEEDLDCGGDCKPCTNNLVFPSRLAITAFWLFSVLFSLLFIREIIALKKHSPAYITKI